MSSTVSDVLTFINNRLKREYGGLKLEDIVGLYTTEQLLEFIFSDKASAIYVDQLGIFKEVVYYLKQLKEQSLEANVLHSIKPRDIYGSIDIDLNSNNITENEMQAIFSCLRRNVELYNELYYKKIHVLETSLNKTIFLNVGRAKLFHILGFNFYDWTRLYREELLRFFPELKNLFNKKYVDLVKDDDSVELYDVLGKILNKEQVILNDLLSKNSELSKAFPLQKIKMKNYLFERDNPYQSKGVIFFDKNMKSSASNLNTDVFLLKDFIQSYRLNWIFSGYIGYNGDTVKSPETLLIGNGDYYRAKNQIIGVTKSINTVSKDDFNPLDYDETGSKFDDEDIINLAKKIIDNFPNSNLAHLNSIVTKKII